MRGQWIGDNTGTNPGTMIVNIDQMPYHYEGIATFIPNDTLQPYTRAIIKTPDREMAGRIDARLVHFDRKSYADLATEELEKTYPGFSFPQTATVEYSTGADSLSFDWTTPAGSSGHASLPASLAGTPSVLQSTLLSWREFKQKVESMPYRRVIFRGQEDAAWRLRTAFHRAGRADLFRFRNEDIPTLNRSLSAHTKHSYNMNIPDHFGALIHLAQHHGYPTPLLDWSYSPYVAAFCAFRKVRFKTGSTQRIRIFVFDNDAWSMNVSQHGVLLAPFLNFSLSEFMAMDNERLLPQQALSCVSNVDDIERYIGIFESGHGSSYLQAIDIAHEERDIAMTDLSRMGITAASMFPSMDGACEELRERMFPRHD